MLNDEMDIDMSVFAEVYRNTANECMQALWTSDTTEHVYSESLTAVPNDINYVDKPVKVEMPPPATCTPPSDTTHASTNAGLAIDTVEVKQELGENPERKLTPLEVRRKRNRESMRRARQRQRDDIVKMRGVLQDLEQKYDALVAKSKEEKAGILAYQTKNQLALESGYYELADLSHRLQSERYMLERMLTEKQKAQRRFQQVLTDHEKDLELDQTQLEDEFFFNPLTQAEADEAICKCADEIATLDSGAKPFDAYEASDEIGVQSPCDDMSDLRSESSSLSSEEQVPSTVSTFGWNVHFQRTCKNQLYASFSKTFEHYTPNDVIEASWTLLNYVERSPKSYLHRPVVQERLLQRINENALVVVTDVKHPMIENRSMRVIRLRFRLVTDNGFVIGEPCLNPSDPELRRHAERSGSFEYADSFKWLEFTTTQEGCLHVKIGMCTTYNTMEGLRLRVINGLSMALRWENAVIKEPYQILPTDG